METRTQQPLAANITGKGATVFTAGDGSNVRAIACDVQQQSFETVPNLDVISDLVARPGKLVWLDLLDPTPEQINKIGEEFNFHPLSLEDVTNAHQRPKIEQYDNYFFVVFYAANLLEVGQDERLQVTELGLFVGPNYLVTVHREPLPALREAQQRWERIATTNSKHFLPTVGSLLYSVLDTIVDQYFPVLDSLVEQVEDVEDQIFDESKRSRRTELTYSILELRKLFLRLRRVISPERDILNTLTNRDIGLFDDMTMTYFRDIYDHLIKVNDTLDVYRDQLSGTMDANLAVASNDLNKVMRTLTATSIVLMADALVAGIYGMNFKIIPELNWDYGYPYAIGLMLLITIGLFTLFKRRGWFN